MRCGAAGQLINVIDWIAGWLADCTRCGFGADTDGEGGRRQVRWTRRDAADIGVVSKRFACHISHARPPPSLPVLSLCVSPSVLGQCLEFCLCSPSHLPWLFCAQPAVPALSTRNASFSPVPVPLGVVPYGIKIKPSGTVPGQQPSHSRKRTSLALSCTASCPHPPACPSTTTTTTNLRT